MDDHKKNNLIYKLFYKIILTCMCYFSSVYCIVGICLISYKKIRENFIKNIKALRYVNISTTVNENEIGTYDF